MQDNTPPVKISKWYHTNTTLIVAFLAAGPLAIPLIWINPRSTPKKKLILTAVMLILSVALAALLNKSLRSISDYYNILSDLERPARASK